MLLIGELHKYGQKSNIKKDVKAIVIVKYVKFLFKNFILFKEFKKIKNIINNGDIIPITFASIIKAVEIENNKQEQNVGLVNKFIRENI